MIDYVFPYVDSSDPVWQQTYKKYCEDNDISSNLLGNEVERFRDWGNLIRFVFRSIAKNMPWINNIFFIVQSESQIPDWLDKSKVKIVLHSDFIPERYLPTYNSTTIEMFLWNIPELGEQFIYGNDDLFALSTCTENDFFSCSGLPKIHLSLKNKVGINAFRKTLIKGQEMINKDFPSIKIPEDKYYRTNHLMSPMLKSTLEQVWIRHRIEICNSISAFRTDNNVNQYIYSLYQVFSNQYVDEKFPGRYFDFEGTRVPVICNMITDKEYKVICINDSGLNNEKEAIDIFNAFQSIFGEKCKYELELSTDTSQKTFNVVEALTSEDFISSSTTIVQLCDNNDLWSVKYIPEHKYPWLLTIKALSYNECFSDTTSIKNAVYKLTTELEPIVKTINDLKNNPIIGASNKFSLDYSGYTIKKEQDTDVMVYKNEKQYSFESLENSQKTLLYIKSKLDKINF